MTKLKQTNWFFLSMLIFVVALPFSEGLISISAGLLLLASLVHLKRKDILFRVKERWPVLIIAGIFVIFVAWLAFNNDWKWAQYDLRKNLFYLLIPLSFVLAPPINFQLQKNVLFVFVLAVAGSSLITVVYFYLQKEPSLLEAQQYGFIHHIRFSFQLILAMVILIYYLIEKRSKISMQWKIATGVVILFLFLVLIWHQSLIGLLTFMGTAFFGVILFTRKLQNKNLRRGVYLILLFLIFVPVAYLYYAVDRFYPVDELQPEELDRFTALGNTYSHDLKNHQLENANYVGLYLCEKELEAAWDKRSEIKYRIPDRSGYPVKYTLIRYMTSKNLRKDAEGVSQLSEQDIRNIESGVSNYIFAQKGLSLYPRIYVSIWELDNYFKTGNANHQSLSQRIEYVRAALTIIQDHFWVGVGTGDWKKAYADAYRLNQSQLDPDRYADAHNQYLNYMVKFGLIGLILIMFLIVFPVLKTKAYKNPVFLLFLASMFIANLGDSNLETHVGANFFIFFYCLFLFRAIGKKSNAQIN